MDSVPQIVPISHMALKQTEVLRKLDHGPVILAQRSRPAAILVSIEEWDKRAHRIEALEKERLLAVTKQRLAEMKSDPSLIVTQSQYEEMLKAEGLD